MSKKKSMKQLPSETVKTVGALIESLQRFPPSTVLARSEGFEVSEVIWHRGTHKPVRAVDICEGDW